MESCGHSAHFEWSHVITQRIDQKLLSHMLFCPPQKKAAATSPKT